MNMTVKVTGITYKLGKIRPSLEQNL